MTAARSEPTLAFLEDGPFTPLQRRVVAFCFALNMLDGMDVLAIAFAAPLIAADWSIDPARLGIVFSAALVGMTLGAALISPWTDRIGRRGMILLSLVIVSVGMIATALSGSVAELIAMRGLTGLGIGAMLASITSMTSEYAPARHRSLCVVTVQAGYPIGAIVTGFVAGALLPAHGWRPLFVLAGLASVVAIPLTLWLLPESLAFLAARRPAFPLRRMNAILARMGRTALDALPAAAAEPPRVGPGVLFAAGRRRATSLLWLAFALSFATLYFLVSWVVKLAVESGLALEHAIYAGVALNLGGFCGSIFLGWISGRRGLHRTIAGFFLAAAASCLAYGFARADVAVTLTLIFVLMFFTLGAFTGLYAVAARLYPTAIRTTGVGWAIGLGRTGAIIGPAAAGFLLAAGLSIEWTFALFALPLLGAAVAVRAMPREP